MYHRITSPEVFCLYYKAQDEFSLMDKGLSLHDRVQFVILIRAFP